MNFWQLRRFWLVAVILTCVQGCTSTAPADAGGAAARELSSENLDLLFATEFPVASKDEAVIKATRAYRAGEFDKAQFYLVQALKFDLTDADILAQIGNLHVRQGNASLAARSFQFALQQSPDHAASLEGMGLLYFKSGNDEQARSHLERAVASVPTLWRSYNALGVISDRQENFELAQTYYDVALEIQPSSDSILINRGYSKYLNKNYHEAALDFYAVAKRSNSAKAWWNLGLVYGKQGWYEDALECFLEAADEREAYNETGAIAMSNGDTEEALHYLTEAIRLSPTYFAEAEKNLAALYQSNSRSYVN